MQPCSRACCTSSWKVQPPARPALGQLLASSHVRILAPGLPPSPCTLHRRFAYHPPSRPRLRGLSALDFRSLPACLCLCLCVLLCLAIESPPPPRPSSRAAAAASPKSISKPYPSQTADPSDDTTTATDGDRKTRAAIEWHLRRRIDPAEYWPCDPRLSTQKRSPPSISTQSGRYLRERAPGTRVS